jgi:hypothetical protein
MLGDLVRWVGRWVWVPLLGVVLWCAVVASPEPEPEPVPDAFGVCMAQAWPEWNGTGSELAAECAEVVGR